MSDEEDNQVEEGFVHKKSRRNEMRNLDAYNSDSEPEADGFSTDEENGKSISGDEQEDDHNNNEDDMFVSDEENTTNKKAHASRKTEFDIDTFNRENEIDTEATSTNGGIQIESFNLEDDIKHGTFDKDGNFTRRQNDDGEALIEDRWMDENSDTKNTAELRRKQQKLEKEHARQVKKNMRHYMVDEALLRLFYFVGRKQTVIQVLGALNKLRSKSKDEVQKRYTTRAIDFVTDLIGILEQKGIEDVYNLDGSKLSQLIAEESLSTTSLIDPDRKIWCFKWIKDLETIHQSYSSKEMESWKKSYFKNNVIVKFQDDEDVEANWIHISCLEFQ